MGQDELEDMLWGMNERGLTPVVVGVDKEGLPFLAYGWAPGGDGWDVGVVTDDTHSLEFDYTDGTTRCEECGAFGRRVMEVLHYPVTVLGESAE